MKPTKNDLARRALARLAADDALEAPDPRLEARLVAAHRRHGSRRPRRRSAPLRWGLGVLVLAGGAVAATAVSDELAAWWYSIRVGDEVATGAVAGDGARVAEFTTDDGFHVRVRVERRDLDGGRATRVHVLEEGPGVVDEEVLEERSVRGDGASPELLPTAALEEAQHLHTWTDADEGRLALLLGRDPEGPGSRLLVHALDSGDAHPVSVVLRTARPIAEGGSVAITERAAGSLHVLLSDGRGWELAVELGGEVPDAPDSYEAYTSPSGRVRVELGE